MKEIADAANVKRPTFYNHFKDKYDVVEYILKQELVEPARTLVACDMLEEAIRLMLMTMKKEKAFYMRVARIGGRPYLSSDRAAAFERIAVGRYAGTDGG